MNKSYESIVTIYIPTYNRVDLLKRAINSVLKQTYKNIEIVVVDDCSTDNTIQYLREISAIDSRVRYFVKDKNSGAPRSRNIAIDNAKGDFITGLDDDDYFTTDRIEKFIINSHLLNRYEFLYSNYSYENGGVINSNKMNKIKQPRNLKFNDLLLTNYVGNQIFTYTERLKKVKGFDTNLKAWQDLELWLRLLRHEGKTAKFLNNETYVVNKNLDLPRITLQNKGPRIKESFDYIQKKFNLSSSLSKILSMQMVNYGVSIPLYYAMYGFLYTGLSIGYIYNLLFLIKLKINFKVD